MLIKRMLQCHLILYKYECDLLQQNSVISYTSLNFFLYMLGTIALKQNGTLSSENSEVCLFSSFGFTLLSNDYVMLKVGYLELDVTYTTHIHSFLLSSPPPLASSIV